MITQLSYKLMLRDILRFVLNLFFGTGERIPLCSFEVHQRIYHIVAHAASLKISGNVLNRKAKG